MAISGFGTALDINGLLMGRFAGLMDEIRIWDRALGHQQIVDGMYLEIERAPNLMGRWGLDELDGWVFDDSTGNDHVGGVHDVTVEKSDVAPIGQPICLHTEPSEVAGVHWPGYPTVRMTWEVQPGMAYDIAGGMISDLRLHAGTTQAQCLIDDHATPIFTEERPDPPPGDGYYFLIRSVGPCAVSSYGEASPDVDRVVLDGCP
jgi:hypothetical protein